MDILRAIARRLELITETEKSEIEPSRSERRADKFIVQVESFWKESEEKFGPDDLPENFSDNGPLIKLYWRCLPIRVVWQSRGSGEHWRNTVITQTMKNVDLFHIPFHVPAFGGMFQGEAADMVSEHIGDFELTNVDGPGKGYVVELNRDENSDLVFQIVTKDGRDNGYIAEQHFTGKVSFQGVLEIPPNLRSIIK